MSFVILKSVVQEEIFRVNYAGFVADLWQICGRSAVDLWWVCSGTVMGLVMDKLTAAFSE